MRFLSVLLRLLGALMILLLGVLLLALSLRLLRIEDMTTALTQLYTSQNVRLILGSAGTAILITTILLAWMIVQQFQKERTIAFRNPDGEVTVALEAIEDFIRRLGSEFSGVREIKPYIKATRSGIVVKVRATLWSDAHIPETTEGLQGIIHNHLHDILGVEEAVAIHIHVGKVIPRTKKVIEEKII
ncbi:MAG: alkaline shock response membrane anchor protein AmaP [Candidatus Omnitrophota bacterium]